HDALPICCNEKSRSLAVLSSLCASANCLVLLNAMYVVRTAPIAIKAAKTNAQIIALFHQSTLSPKSWVRRTRDWMSDTFSPSAVIALFIILSCVCTMVGIAIKSTIELNHRRRYNEKCNTKLPLDKP